MTNRKRGGNPFSRYQDDPMFSVFGIIDILKEVDLSKRFWMINESAHGISDYAISHFTRVSP
jgi:hypothetical protein